MTGRHMIRNGVGTAEEMQYSANENHFGVDITGKKGSSYDVVSVCNGKVIATSANRANNPSIAYATRKQRHTVGGLKDGGGYGNFVIIQDPSNGKCFLYAHLKASTISVKKGDSVTTNQKIGVMGSSGDSGHMHLHFEVRKNLAAITTTGGQYFTVTTGYNIETENPENYIGSVPSRAGVAKISSVSTSTGKTITITFNKNINLDIPNIAKAPKLRVKSGSKTIDLVCTSTGSNNLVYNMNITNLDTSHNGTIYADSILGTSTSTINFSLVDKIKQTSLGTVNLSAAKIASISNTLYGTNKNKITYTFNKNITVKTKPTLKATINGKTLKVTPLSTTSNKISYSIDYSEMGLTEKSEVKLSLTGGDIVNAANPNIKASYNGEYIKEVDPIVDLYVETEYKSSEGEGKLNDSVYYPSVVNNKDSDVIVTVKSKDNVKIQLVNNIIVPSDGTKNKLGWYYPDKNDVTMVAKVYSLEDFNNETDNGKVSELIVLASDQLQKYTSSVEIVWGIRIKNIEFSPENIDENTEEQTIKIATNIPIDKENLTDGWSMVEGSNNQIIKTFYKENGNLIGNVTIYNLDNSSNIDQEIKVSFVDAKEENDKDLAEDEALDNELAEDEKDSNEQEKNKEEETENKNSFIEKLPSILPNTGESIILIAIILISITVAIINKRKIKIK